MRKKGERWRAEKRRSGKRK